MKPQTSFTLAFFALVAPAVAQDVAPPTPSPKLEAFAPWVGTWAGAGKAVFQEGAPAGPWSCTVDFKPILDGFFFQDDTHVDIPGVPTALQMRTVYGWDAENERYIAYGVGNTGESHTLRAHFPSPGTLVMGFTGEQDGEAVVTRTVMKVEGDKMSLFSERANGAGKWFTEVEGVMTRVEALPKGVAADASFMSIPAPAPMTRITDAMAGTYDVAGSMTMAPGMPELKIRGTETMKTIFGGHALLSTVEGHADNDDALYVGHTYMTWDANDNCYDLVMFDNMGAVALSEARFADDGTLVGVSAGPMMGELTAQRSVIKLGEHGVTEATSHMITGAHPPMQSFHAKYVRK